ncbi:MAG TPA: hypothetical protein VFP10_04990 [Candidatus Eisenbacteria bacterium]|nr:hypothetical protein [Candidatus Eisenbacteria bacterium]
MKLVQLVGILCILAGAFVLIRGFTYTKQENVIEIGDLKAGVQEKKSVPAWVGGLGIVAGIGLVVIGARSKP